MDVYVVESFADVLPHASGFSRGVEAEGFTGEGRLFVHLLPVEDREARSLGVIDRALHRHGPTGGEWWVVEGDDAYAHWPGLPGVRARSTRGKPVALRDQLSPARTKATPATRARATPSKDSATTRSSTKPVAATSRPKAGTAARTSRSGTTRSPATRTTKTGAQAGASGRGSTR
jgi:hypothetical protein